MRLLIGVTGGIAAYKALELVRLATRAGHQVRVIQTPTSERFVGTAAFAAITGAPVLASEFEADPARGGYPGDAAADWVPISHLALVERADVYLIAPASANTLAKLAVGIADNLVTTAALAADCPLLLAPAMNNRMFLHPATQANVATLRARGVCVLEPASGALASRGEAGIGRLPEPAELLAAVETAHRETDSSWEGLRVLVSAGGTREPIDPVRYIGNHSSGRMGYAVAAAARRRGAQVTLLSANVTLPTPAGAEVIRVGTAAEMLVAAERVFPAADVLVMTAAVADFRPARPAAHKLKKTTVPLTEIALEPTTDILARLASQRRPGQTLVGFAAEHGAGAVAYGADKLERKGLDLVVVNDVSRSDIGFDSAENEVTLITATGAETVTKASKAAIAETILDTIVALRRGTAPAAPAVLSAGVADGGPGGVA
ncbi:bifunctional phosphopantothenoylcysteine decarboxylase/phosphopantothenate--cysteine ligase CoaBC [Conexibacter sp. DBS9H8]|uniref:bifunctional phosphopantothenoylcysteine decarboxylase/phosphopantothenate--cysteine ligase CoaBC n=1 Tax=Conexibacter sp. DBS9H8 TaxID=2937801 RepID=UPI00200E94EB|nr:bifunctional phosphopantothenoylcysteine decarboxylase/phosphopantothenate--cysteine ligase CoaBC [Conexibacter sp. DBS9H8]